MHVEICDVSCVLVKTVKTQKQIKYQKKKDCNKTFTSFNTPIIPLVERDLPFPIGVTLR